jgi:hypothetical protein
MLVPMATTPIATPSRGRVEARLRTTVDTGVRPSEEPASTALYLPRVQIDGGAGIRFHEHFTLRVRLGTFLDVDAQRVGADTHRPPGLAGYMVGVAPTLTVPLDRGRTLLTVGPDFTLALGSIRWEEYELCETPDGETYNCGAEYDRIWLAMMFGGSASASRWLGDVVRITGTLGVRSQPGYDGAFASDMPTDFGLVAVVLGAEVLFQITDELLLAVESQWLGVAGPYVVYPTVGITLGGTFGRGPGFDPRHPDAPPRTRPEPATPTIRPL